MERALRVSAERSPLCTRLNLVLGLSDWRSRWHYRHALGPHDTMRRPSTCPAWRSATWLSTRGLFPQPELNLALLTSFPVSVRRLRACFAAWSRWYYSDPVDRVLYALA